MKKIFYTLGVGLLVLALPTISVQAQQTRETDLCAAAAIEAERILEIPAYLLQAIALTESGRWDSDQKRLKPWPWAVGAQKKSWYFSSKSEAVNHVKNLQEQGITNIDVGCMQINLYYHGHTFNNLDEVFNPINNVAYAGIFLSELFRLKQSWNEAVKFYHSANPKFNRRYIRVVYDSWQKLRDQARASGQTTAEIGLIEPPSEKIAIVNTDTPSAFLTENEKNRETQSILQSEEVKQQQEAAILKDVIRYDAFARVAAAQRLEREFDLNLDNVPPPIIIPEELLDSLDRGSRQTN